MSVPTGKRVLICHYRVGWTDGVSLEIEKRQHILEESGYRVTLLAGPGSRGADHVIEELDFDTPEARAISRNAFNGLDDIPSEVELMERITALSDTIEARLNTLFASLRPDFVLLHNIFSHGRHIAAARAFHRVLSRHTVPALATHHDYYWERDDFRSPSGPLIEAFLKEHVPPRLNTLRHASINTLAARALKERRGIEGMVFPDTLDFTQPPWVEDSYNRRLYEDFSLNRHDIHVLQATRIVRRKGIELMIPLLAALNEKKSLDQLRGRTLYNGKKITPESRFVFLLAGYAEQEAEPYRQQLIRLLEEHRVPYRFLTGRIASERGEKNGRPLYSLFDTYPLADLISYPSLFEGWGNQLLEAFFAQKPPLCFEYPVFQSDIKPRGYRYISLGDRASQNHQGLYALPPETREAAVAATREWLLSEETPARLKHNYTLARTHNSYDTLRELMTQGLEPHDPR